MNDPRKLPDWKQKRYEDRVLLLLGALLDALAPAPTAEPAVTPVKPPRRSRSA